MGAISIRNVIKRYGRGAKANQVIHGVSAEIADGEFIVIVGPSGCGKSTLLRMVAGLEQISEGEIAIGGRVVNNVEPADRDIAMVFQNYALYPHMSVYDNMAYGLKIARVPKAEIDARVNKAAGILELGPFLQRTPRQLSGGQRQRVAMGRAIVRQPAAFLFDEPLSNLDAKLRAQTRLEIQKLHRELGVTSLFVTHDQVEAMTLAQRMIVMNAGRVEQIGTPEQVYGRPASSFVASFIGSPPMNLLAGQADGARFTVGSGAGAITLPLPSSAPRGGALLLGLRPEHTEIDPAGLWPMTVDTVEMLGAERLVHGRIGAGSGGELFTVRIDATRSPPRAGDAVRLTASPDHLHWFDAATGLGVGAEMPAWPYPRWIAHRGAGKLAPENTLAAFRLGAALGYRAFECDVKLSADGVPFLLHDAALERTTSGSGLAGDKPWHELSQLDAGSWHGRLHAGEPPPTLAAIAAFVLGNHHSLNIEIKPTPGTEQHTGQVVAGHAARLWAGQAAPPLLSSFRPEALLGAREAAPQLPRALLLDALWPDWDQVAASLGCVAIVGHHVLIDAGLLARARDAGWRVLAYTVNEPADAQRLRAQGIDGIITDAVDRFSPGGD